MHSLVAAPPRTLSSLAGRLLVAFSLSLLIACSALAQGSWSATDGKTPTSLAPGAPAGSYPLSGIDNVNLYNGNLNFALPLLQIGGRGGAGASITLPIETHWREVHTVPAPICNQSGCSPGTVSTVYPTPNGWNMTPRYGLGAVTGRYAAEDETEIYDSQGNVICRYYLKTLTRLTFTAPDGTEIELRDKLHEGQALAQTCQTTPARGSVFATADGSSATFTSDVDINDRGSNELFYPTGYLVTRDGTLYRVVNGIVTSARDRNGNLMTVTLDPATNKVTAITDSLKRQVTISYANGTTTYDQISFKGTNGDPRTIRIYYGSLSSALRTGFSVQTYYQLFPNLSGSSASVQFNPTSMVTAVELPDGRKYQFKYNSYGELARVDLPTGGRFEYDYTGALGTQVSGNINHEISQRRVYSDAGTTLVSKT